WAVLGVLLLQLAQVPSQARADAGKPLTWAADAEGGAPYIFKDPQNPAQNIGFEVDIAAALARQLGRPIQFKQYEFNSLFSGLKRGDFDFSMHGLEASPHRRKRFRCSRPYYLYKLQFGTRKGEPRFRTLEECKGRKDLTVGTMEDTAAERLLDQMGIPKKI